MDINLQDFFRKTRHNWESGIIWDSEDRNFNRIDARAEFLTNLALDMEDFAAIPVTDIKDAALEYVTKD